MLAPLGTAERKHELLRMSAKPFPFLSVSADHILKRLAVHHAKHPDHKCLTSKHVGDEYAAISLHRSKTDEILIVLDPSEYDDIGYARTFVQEESDFFPHMPPIYVERSLTGRVSYAGVDGKRKRELFEREDLLCLVQAMEILNGKHYERWTKRNVQ